MDREINSQTHKGVRDLQELGATLSSPEQQKSTADRFRKLEGADADGSFEKASKALYQLGYDVTRCLTAVEEQHDYGECNQPTRLCIL